MLLHEARRAARTSASGDMVLLVGIIVVLLSLDFRLGLLTLSTMPVLFVVRIFWLPRAKRAFWAAHETNSITAGAMAEGINGVRTVQNLDRQKVNFDLYDDKAYHNLRTQLTGSKVTADLTTNSRIFLSGIMVDAKPDARAFHHACADLGVDAALPLPGGEGLHGTGKTVAAEDQHAVRRRRALQPGVLVGLALAAAGTPAAARVRGSFGYRAGRLGVAPAHQIQDGVLGAVLAVPVAAVHHAQGLLDLGLLAGDALVQVDVGRARVQAGHVVERLAAVRHELERPRPLVVAQLRVGVRPPHLRQQLVGFESSTQRDGHDVLRQQCKHVEEMVYQGSGVRPNRVIPVAPHTVPKTTSGKIKRAYIRQNIEAFRNWAAALPDTLGVL